MRFRGGRGFGAYAREAMDAQAGQAVFTLAGYEEVGEEVHVFEHHRVAMGDSLGPFAWRGYGGCDQAEVAAAIVGADEPQAVAMVDGVLVIVLAGADEGECAFGVRGWKYVGFAGDVAGRFKHDEICRRGCGLRRG
jgi:hypothetical protein